MPVCRCSFACFLQQGWLRKDGYTCRYTVELQISYLGFVLFTFIAYNLEDYFRVFITFFLRALSGGVLRLFIALICVIIMSFFSKIIHTLSLIAI